MYTACLWKKNGIEKFIRVLMEVVIYRHALSNMFVVFSWSKMTCCTLHDRNDAARCQDEHGQSGCAIVVGDALRTPHHRNLPCTITTFNSHSIEKQVQIQAHLVWTGTLVRILMNP